MSLRVLYLYPDEITDELLEVIKNEPKLAKYFDIDSARIKQAAERNEPTGDEVFAKSLDKSAP